LFAYLERHADALQARVPDADSLAGRVRKCLIARLRDGEPEQPTIARALGLSERTLQRRLRAEHTTFAALLDQVRSELASMYLLDPQLAVFEVAYLLGFSEPSAFNRAFRRWTGKTPREFRR
jgi:AraC-like DNA-binding protein